MLAIDFGKRGATVEATRKNLFKRRWQKRRTGRLSDLPKINLTVEKAEVQSPGEISIVDRKQNNAKLSVSGSVQVPLQEILRPQLLSPISSGP
jgi:hypothetical protein